MHWHTVLPVLLTAALVFPAPASAQSGPETPDATYWQLRTIDRDSLPVSMTVEGGDDTRLRLVYRGAMVVFRTNGQARLQLGLDVLALDGDTVNADRSVRGALIDRRGAWAWDGEDLVMRVKDGGWSDRSGGAFAFGTGGEERFRIAGDTLFLEADLGGDGEHTFRFVRYHPSREGSP